ncbi:MAG: GAF domain-containing protein [Anaerolineales bacterium]|nr:GAF domain-containing protein [Chloroflexota bacterium]MBL6983799.1 GAF domain-containing protein [Anaerolineales bacterium]
MQDETTTLTLLPDQQLLQISNQIDLIREALEEQGHEGVARAADNLTRLAGHITRIGRQVSEHGEELKDLRALADIGQVVNSSLDLPEVLRIVMDTIIRLTGAERGFLMLRDENGSLEIRIARNWEQESIQESDFEISRTVIDRVVEDVQPIVTTNAIEDPRFGGQDSIVAYNLRSILCVPLKVKEELTGVIYADNRIRTGLFTNSERDLLSAFANQAAVAIENARLFESVRQTLAEVTELKNLMDNVFASIASGVITTDIQNRITLCNRAAEQILARTSIDLLQHDLLDSLPELASILAKPIIKVQKTDESLVGMELNPTLPQRGPVNLQLNLSPLKDAQATTQGVAIVLNDVTERRRLEAQRRLFARMVSPAVIDQLDPDKIQLGGERANITTLFADIRGFTSFSENLTPEELVSVLNQYLAAATDAILEQEGTVDKFMGDAVMAWFNAPIPQADHTLRAVRAAIGMRQAVYELHNLLPKKAQLDFGLGIHYGEAVLGLIGTEERIDYTAIGDSVNTAKRIQENSRSNQILISAAAYQFVKDQIEVQPAEPILAKGKSHPLELIIR